MELGRGDRGVRRLIAETVAVFVRKSTHECLADEYLSDPAGQS